MECSTFIFFPGTCEEALAFYTGVFGGGVSGLMRVADTPMARMAPPEAAQKIMRAEFSGNGVHFFASDNMDPSVVPAGFALSVNAPDHTAAERVFSDLATGGEVRMPFADGPNEAGAKFGMLEDRFGIAWMVSSHDA